MVQKKLMNNDIIPRRYFYPSLNLIDYVKGQSMPVSESISSRIMCLPLFVNMNESDLKKIAKIISENV